MFLTRSGSADAGSFASNNSFVDASERENELPKLSKEMSDSAHKKTDTV